MTSTNFASVLKNLGMGLWQRIDGVEVPKKGTEFLAALKWISGAPWNTGSWQRVWDGCYAERTVGENLQCVCSKMGLSVLYRIEHRASSQSALVGSCCVKKVDPELAKQLHEQMCRMCDTLVNKHTVIGRDGYCSKQCKQNAQESANVDEPENLHDEQKVAKYKVLVAKMRQHDQEREKTHQREKQDMERQVQELQRQVQELKENKKRIRGTVSSEDERKQWLQNVQCVGCGNSVEHLESYRVCCGRCYHKRKQYECMICSVEIAGGNEPLCNECRKNNPRKKPTLF